MSREYRVIYNCYDGKGNNEYIVTDDLRQAYDYLVWAKTFITAEKGKAWLEARYVGVWQEAEIIERSNHEESQYKEISRTA